jgi:hypothetical protein
MKQVSKRESFVARFGEDQACAIEKAAEGHKNGIHDNPGNDPFRWAIAICIGYQCMEKEEYRAFHGITVPVEEVKAWCQGDGDLAGYSGDVAYVGLFASAYNGWVKPTVEEATA